MEQQKKRKSPPLRRKITHEIGEWSWNHDNLKSKILPGANFSDCSSWKGSTGPETHLYGGFKNGVPQMTQARRLYWMGERDADISDYRVTMRCHNSYCMNLEHMELAPNLKLFKNDGQTPANKQSQPRIKKVKTLKEITEEEEKW